MKKTQNVIGNIFNMYSKWFKFSLILQIFVTNKKLKYYMTI